jgi:hypothetical protein
MELVFKYKARAPQAVLKDLAEDTRRHEKVEALPRVVLWTRAGVAIEGRLLDVAEDKWGGAALLLSDRDQSAAFVRLDEIVGVDVKEAGKFAQVLSQGDIPRPLGKTPPTRLELKRRYAALPSQISGLGLTLETDADWEKVPDDETVPWNLADLADALQKAISESANDAVGKAAWAPIRRIRIVHQTGAPLAATRDGDLVRVVVDLKQKLPTQLSQALAKVIGDTL